ncbi:PepSY-associated TM helix domain-containing protein [Massilia sp. W12]|uniref:PepSY-associated TM helix domain-containing protein n=1 Tax=Massilia sp. W12 TaxID=3126507 RepID=UPI0030D01387
MNFQNAESQRPALHLVTEKDVEQMQQRKPSRRAQFLRWLRATHLYLGLWGAVLGLLFGFTGILLNHRSVMKIPVERHVQSTAQLPLPNPMFQDPQQMAEWLQKQVKLESVSPPSARRQEARKVSWGELEVMQPERWNVSLHTPGSSISAEYIVGNRFIKVERFDATLLGMLTRLHTGTGVNTFWILLADSIAGSLILLSLSGLLLWTQLHTVRTLGVLTASGALCGLLGFVWLT